MFVEIERVSDANFASFKMAGHAITNIRPYIYKWSNRTNAKYSQYGVFVGVGVGVGVVVGVGVGC